MKSSDLDEMLGAPARLAIVTTLAGRPEAAGGGRWTFTALRRETGLADGNLHVQTRKLVGAGYLSSTRIQRGNREVTCFELTESGRKALRSLSDRLRQALNGKSQRGNQGESTQNSHQQRPAPTKSRQGPIGVRDDSRVW